MIDKSGTFKVIDFGIGKLIEPAQADDSLRSQINRRNADSRSIPSSTDSEQTTKANFLRTLVKP